MAVIGKIRQRSGLLLVIIGLALAAFVLGDLFKNIGKANNFDQSRIALINDEKVSSQDFSQRVSEQADITMRNMKKSSLTPEESYQNVMSVWSIVKRETIMRQQMQELGLIQIIGNDILPKITMDEYMNNLIGDHPHQEIIRNFSDPKTGQFNSQGVTNFLNYLEQGVKSEDQEQRQQALESQAQWDMLKKYIRNDIGTQKYNNLLSKAYYLPKALAKVDFLDNSVMNKVAYNGAHYRMVTDEEAEPKDADYQAYYDEHKSEFENKKESRKIEYITWDVRPTNKDIADLDKQIQDIGQELGTVEKENIPYFVNRLGNNRYDSSWVKEGSLSPFIDSAAFAVEVGTVLGPWSENSAYHVAKVIDRSMRPDSMEVSHILIAYAGAYGASDSTKRTKIAARALADSILAILKNKPSEFDALVSKSDDPSYAENKGSLGMFADGNMIPQINNACLEGKKGDFAVVETPYGFHIIRIDDKMPDNEKVRIAKIDLNITFSQETFNGVYSEAIKFAAVNQNYQSFDTSAASQGLNVIKGDFVDKLAGEISGIKNSRDVVKWMYEDKTGIGTVSNVFDFENKVMVAVLTDIRPKGILPLEAVKEDIKPLVMRDVKARILIDKMKNVTSLTDANMFDAKADTATVSFASYSLPNYTSEQNVEGRISVAEQGKLVGPIKGEQAVFFFNVIEAGKEPAQIDMQYFQQRNADNFNQRVSTSAYDALEKNAVIEDFLYFFY